MGMMQKRILIIDDEMETADLLRTLLTLNQFDVHVANGGKEGLHIAQTYAPDLILLDILMPNMDGWEMLKRVRDKPETAKVTVIALTAHAMSGDQQRALDAGFDSYITKPLILGTFLAEIKRALQAKKADA